MLSQKNLKEQIIKLQSKPGHENVKHLLRDILKEQLGATDNEIVMEDPLKIVCKGRIDTLWGRTIFEVKKDLNKELSNAENQIKKYIQSKEVETKEKYVGIATDGQKYITYCLLNDDLKEINQFTLNKDKTGDFIQWLESVILIKDQLEATPEIICKEIGQESPLCRNSLIQIQCLWDQIKYKPDIKLKYSLWKKSVEIVYGATGTNESLFIEHTYLTIISKAIAHIAFFDSVPLGKQLLSGKLFKDSSVFGVVEDDFFSWISFCNKGNDLIKHIALHIKRFDFSTIEADILKGLYEGLIRPEQRHKMGEYYTPDWLAEKMCKEVIKEPLKNRIIDPACGSGTFLFHSIRLLISKAEKENISSKEVVSLICKKIAGIDIHPVAVIFSRITYLLAMLSKMKKERPNNVNIPVYLGDSLQWSKNEVLGKSELRINVPEDKQVGARRRQLVFPESICLDSNKFEIVLRKMIELAGKYKEMSIFYSWIKTQTFNDYEVKILSNTYNTLLELQQEKRNHIWGYVARNLTRPIWLSSEKQKADIVIGNPPWLKFNSMNEEMQKKLEEECFSINLWKNIREHSKFKTNQDISTYFFIRSVDLYMKEKGIIAFVMPYSVMRDEHHSIFRTGDFERNSGCTIHIKFKNAWVFGSNVKNLFKVPSCVLFSVGKEKSEKAINKNNVLYFKGELPKKNASLKQANKALSTKKEKWSLNHYEKYSYYYDRCKAGTQLTPRRFIFIEKIEKGKLGFSSETPLIRGITSNLDKAPWKDIEPLESKIESLFLKTIYKGESIAPFRVLNKSIAIVPWNEEFGLMDSDEAEKRGYTNLSDYLERVEKLWKQHSKKAMTFKRRINYNSTLENQFPISKLRIVYTSSGTYPAATLLEDDQSIIEVSLHWINVKSKNEGLYLEGILNSDSLRQRIENLQPQGQWGARHIHRHLLKPPIPKYEPKEQLHKDIVEHVKKIKTVAQNVDLDTSLYFKTARKKIRNKIKNTGQIWNRFNELVNILLDERQSFPKAS